MASQYDSLPEWQYFTAFHTTRKAVCKDCPQRPYISLSVPYIPGNRVVVRRAVFTTISHDQGWATFRPELNGTYEDTWTYFEVRVVDSTGRDRIPREVTTQNVRASSEPKKHVVCWDFRDDKYWLLSEEHKEAPASHSGITPSKWMAALQAGDIIQTVPRAEFLAWVNNIVEARIEIWIELFPERSHPGAVHATNTYEAYRPLQIASKEIRLVNIEPSNNHSGLDEEEPPHLTLKYTNLGGPNHDQYETLSYCWGDRLSTSPIFLRSSEESPPREVQIGTDLRNALKRLRQPDQTRTFWIDLLCINQLDPEERSHQVALMGEIYASAKSLSVWLGELEDDHFHTQSDLAVWQTIATTSEKNPAESHGNAGLWHDRVFLRPWFQRVWVVQEVWNTLSSRLNQDNDKYGPISVLCGHLKLPWWLVVQANICLFHNFPSRRNWSMPVLWTELLNVTRDRHTPHHVAAGPRLDILSIVIKGLDMKATDPRDRIFALLIFGWETYRIAELDELLRPDYAKTIEQVYTNFTIWWIKQNHSLRILSAVHTLRHRT
jgi:hypothetical protein